MPALSERAFTKAVRRLDGPAFRAFVADLWAARGEETTIAGDRVIVTDPSTGERTVLLPVPDSGWLRRGTLESPSDPIDVVVSVDRRGAGEQVATEQATEYIDAGELRQIALYAIERSEREWLFMHHLGRSATVPATDAERRVGTRAVWGGLVFVALFVFLAIFAGPATPWIPASFADTSADGDTPLQTGPNPGDTLTHPRAELTTDINTGTKTTTETDPAGTERDDNHEPIWDRPLPAIGNGDQAWRSFRFDPARTGATSATNGPVGNVSIDRTVTMPYRIIASPIVVEGRLYVTDFGGNLYAMNAETLETGWRAQLSGRTTATPTIDNETLYTATSRNTNTGPRTHLGGPKSTLQALSTETGATRWIRAFESVVLSSPVIVDGTLYVGSIRGTVHAVRATNGSNRWNTSVGGQIFASPAISEGTLYIGSTNNGVYALSTETGNVSWRFRTDGRVLSSPAVVNGTVYVGSADGRLYALDAETGTERWNHSTGNVIYSSPAVAKGVVYIGNQGGRVIAIDATAGTERWNRTYPGDVLSSPAVVRNTVYVGIEILIETENDTRGGVVALATATGDTKWTVTTAGSVGTSPAVTDGTLYIGDYNGIIYRVSGCTDLGTGSREAVWLAEVACS